jgi:hypothetical protein
VERARQRAYAHVYACARTHASMRGRACVRARVRSRVCMRGLCVCERDRMQADVCASVHHINVPGMRTNQKIKVGSQRVK